MTVAIFFSAMSHPVSYTHLARFLHAEIFSDQQVGVTQEHTKTEFEYRLEALAEGDPIEFMTLLYPHMLIDETGIEGYRSFVRAVLDAKDGSALWHCYVGRDRCGMGSALVETMLGVSRDDILNDYLATNLYAPIELTLDSPASRCYFEAVEQALEPRGGFMGYLTSTLGLSLIHIFASGTSWCSSSIWSTTGFMSDVPVTLQPGASLSSTGPDAAKSVMAVHTTGMSAVAPATACAAGVAMARIKSQPSLTSVLAMVWQADWSF